MTQLRDRIRIVVLLNNRLRPYCHHDALRIQHGAVMLHHVKKSFKHSRGKRDSHSIQPPQKPFSGVELKRAELVDMTRSSPHRSFQIIQEKFSRTLKTFIRAPACSTTRKFDQTSPAHKENKTHKNSKSKTTTQDKKNEKG